MQAFRWKALISKQLHRQDSRQLCVIYIVMHIKSFETGFAYFPDKTGIFEHYFMVGLIANIKHSLIG